MHGRFWDLWNLCENLREKMERRAQEISLRRKEMKWNGAWKQSDIC